jgi:5-methylcytosine-specific restriction enzyme A
MAWGVGARERTTTARHRRQRLRILERDDYRCQLRRPGCLGVANEMDHIIAVARGGSDDDDNQQAVCHPCHVSKTDDDRAAKRALAKYPAGAHPGLR